MSYAKPLYLINNQGFTGPTGDTGPQGIPGTSNTGPTGPFNTQVQSAMNEPMGHVDRSTSNISYNSITRQFTISPISTSYEIWIRGQLFTISAPQTVTITNATGLYFIFFSIVAGNPTLGFQADYFLWDKEAPTAYIYYNQSYPDEYMLFDERHGITMDWATHEYLHRTRGAAIANGFVITTSSLELPNPTNSDLSFNLTNGTFFDEDLQVDIANDPAGVWVTNLNPVLFPIIYLEGTAWRKTTATNIPLLNAGSGSRPYYNSINSGSGTLTITDDNQYINMWIVASNMVTTPILAIMGQQQYSNVDKAQQAEWDELDLPNLPVVELRPLYQMTYRVRISYTNDYKSSLYSVKDIRSFSSITGIQTANQGPIGPTGPTGPPGGIISSWNITPGTANYSFDVSYNNTYVMWVLGNIPNGIITWNATVTLSNPNVPVIGSQYGWYYTGSSPPYPLILNTIPSQIIGTSGTILSSSTATPPTNQFIFNITNNSGSNQTINYGYLKIS
jgi:hypothetical protein